MHVPCMKITKIINNNFNPEPWIKMVSRKLCRDGGQGNNSHHIQNSLRETFKWGGIWGREENINCEASVASVTACPHLHPSTGCHLLCGRARRDKHSGLLLQGWHKSCQNNLSQTQCLSLCQGIPCYQLLSVC